MRRVRASGGRRWGAARPLTPFIGREEELGLLTRRWERAQAGEGQLVFIVGEPGIGKSRLVEEFRAKLAETSHTWVEWSALQLLQNTPLHPIAEWGRIRFEVDLPEERRLADLENTSALIGLEPAGYAALLAPLLDIPLPAARAPNLPPEELRRKAAPEVSSRGFWRERAHKLSHSLSKTCNGLIRPRSISCGLSPGAGPGRRSSSSRRRGRSSSRLGAYTRITA